MTNQPTSSAPTVTVAAAQTDPRLGAKQQNLLAIEKYVRDAATRQAKLVVFPECALNGYRFESRTEALEDAEPVPGPATDRLAAVAAETGCYIAVGLVERGGDRLYNCAALIGPDGLVGKYHKTHLPFQAVDRFVEPGAFASPIFDTPIGRVGMLICFDLRHPEPARVLALGGAQIIANLTTLPGPGWPQPEFMFQTRAAENRIWLVCADRVGVERGCRYIGRSAIIDPEGNKIAEADDSSESLLVADIMPAKADEKDLIIDPGVYEMHLLGARRPELYQPLVSSGARPTVG